jgi:hypothetical protein
VVSPSDKKKEGGRRNFWGTAISGRGTVGQPFQFFEITPNVLRTLRFLFSERAVLRQGPAVVVLPLFFYLLWRLIPFLCSGASSGNLSAICVLRSNPRGAHSYKSRKFSCGF